MLVKYFCVSWCINLSEESPENAETRFYSQDRLGSKPSLRSHTLPPCCLDLDETWSFIAAASLPPCSVLSTQIQNAPKPLVSELGFGGTTKRSQRPQQASSEDLTKSLLIQDAR